MIFFDTINKYFEKEIEFFGKNINPIHDKADALLRYKFSICIENSSINDYWTEKFADPILAYTIPIYYGCMNIEDYYK